MISINNLNIALLLQCIIAITSHLQVNPAASQRLEPTLNLASGVDGTLVYTLADGPSEFNNQRQQQQTPGHYEFEVAPNLEPPSVRKPPYKQSNQQCPGSGE